MNPKDLKYSKAHTWAKQDGDEATVGITSYAQEQLGNVLFVEMKDIGDKVAQGQPCGSVESDKATSDVVCPVSGEVTAVNEDVLNAPEVLNEDPYGKGWLVKVRVSNPSELNSLLSADAYEASLS